MFCGSLLLAGAISLGAATPGEDYNQWKEALATHAATAATHLTSLPGFAVELVRSARPEEGSWVALAFDPRGRIVLAREDRGLLRLTLSEATTGADRIEILNTNLLECRGLLFAHGALYANANNSRGLYRLRDTDGDDRFDEVRLLRETPGGVGHGRNQLALGPDGKIYSIHGDDVQLPAEGADARSPFAHYGEDRLLPASWDKHLFSTSVKMPCGHLIRTDPDGRAWELVAGGFRNPFGIAFNADGELFTFDADMEWDVGLPWYHSTRVLHVVPGGDYGWRRGTGVLPVWSPDTLPGVLDVGLSSPTAVMFGTRSRFPAPYRDALYLLDWSYGRILAAHLTPTNATYAGRLEVFLKGRPLNVTGLDFGPDGAMYFITGGRRTQSGLYRVRAMHADSDQAQSSAGRPADRSALGARRMLERLPGQPGAASLEQVWQALSSADRWTQYAARTALERLPAESWQGRVLAVAGTGAGSESGSGLAVPPGRRAAQCAALLALARVGGSAAQPGLRERAVSLISPALPADPAILALRALAVSYARHGPPAMAEAKGATDVLSAIFPGPDRRVNQQLCELLVYLESPDVVRRAVPLIAAATQEEKIQYLFLLRLVKTGWSPADRRSYFEALDRGRTEFRGANMLITFLNHIRADAESTLAAGEKVALADVLRRLDRPLTAVAAGAVAAAPASPRPFVREWVPADFAGALGGPPGAGAAERGRRLFAGAGCVQCHRFGRDGGLAGPDLTAVGSRFDRRALLESILEPSKVVAEVYRQVSLTLKSGAIVDGRVLAEDATTLSVNINPADPDQRRRIKKAEVQSQRISELSPMPAGLVNTLTREQILDLVAFLEAGEAAALLK